jgi:pilus assembly protein CpaB
MSQRAFAILLIAFAISATVYRLALTPINLAPDNQTSEVVIAAHKLEIGTLVKDTDLRGGQWLGPLPRGIVLKKEDVVGRGVIAVINEGEPIFENRLAAVGAVVGLAATIPPGMRAVAIRTNDIVGVARFVVSGQRVDVLINGTPPGGAPNRPKVKTLLQNIEVLSAGTNFQKDAEGKPVQVPVVNLLVTPAQAEVLSLAKNQTAIQLILRNPLDNEATKTPGSAVSNLFGEAKPAPVPGRPRPIVAQAKPVVPVTSQMPPSYLLVEVLNGPKRSEVKFADKLNEAREAPTK